MTTAGRLWWTEASDGLAVSVHRFQAGWAVTTTWPTGRGGGAARDTREAALDATGELLALTRENEARRVGRVGR